MTSEQCAACAKPLRGNPNGKQCEGCLRLFCSSHQRLVEWGIRMCVNCKPPIKRQRRSRWS